jgi:two-component system chemotaxis response regulator CheB
MAGGIGYMRSSMPLADDPGHAGVLARDIVVIGCSAGGVRALMALTSALPPDLPASLFVVMHVASDHKSLLPDILSHYGRIPAVLAEEGAPVEAGHVYIAPPDHHLLLDDRRMRLNRGPKENHARPAVDPLFRSAAAQFGDRVVGVVLTGMLYDGTAGLIAVKRHGGIAIVQEPDEAEYASMPLSAINRDHPDYILPLDDIATILPDLVRGGRPNAVPGEHNAGRETRS